MQESTHPVGIDAFNEGPASVARPDGGPEDAVHVDVVAGDVTGLWRGSLGMIPADDDRLVQLPFQRQLPRRRD